ncbi:hypothetical protein DWB85_05340 [Seongchinamella sediminis]|uniref:Uncharacterized protein n=1 Tax=Seongchinamella sediminis TaxID=2283635 RepID=A0A3L7E2A8_9GAMM|nr:hypothetical protein [Seongchinamella sediminis]RLQ22870.1 hypothetical protein DWB85_05340 [Seongchinamella sediminis]
MHHRETGAVRPLVLLMLVCLALPAAADQRRLDVGVAIFDPGIPADESTHNELGIFPRIRQAEAKYLPVTLRRELVDSGQWGVVRVLPELGVLSELTVQGRILESNGRQQRIHARVIDATGRRWLDREYAASAVTTSPPGNEPYRQLYARVAADMLDYRRGLTASQLREIRGVALMRYAQSLSPDAFAAYLGRDGEGHQRLQRLPAEGDPMMSRVERIRNQEYLFIDNVDEQFGDLHDQMAATYVLWLAYDREQNLFREDYEQRAANREQQGRAGSFAAMQQSYFAYRNFRIQEQDLDELALGFNNEIAPTIMATSGRVFRLTGTLDSQYTEWRQILRQIFALETGLPPAAGGDNSSFSNTAQ